MAEQLPHLIITGTASTEQYVYAGGIPQVEFQRPPRDSRPQHAAQLSSQIEQAQADADAQTPPDEAEQRRGITLEFQSEPDFGLWLDSLENRQQGIELANVRLSGNVTCGTVFVPEGRIGFFLKRIEQYANEDTDNRVQWAGSINLLNLLAELRRAKEVPTAYVSLPPQDQMEFIEDARERIVPPPANAPAVCLLDTGVNRSHPLLELVLDEPHVMAVDPNWLAADHDGHGTEMAGLALYGCLTKLFTETGPHHVTGP